MKYPVKYVIQDYTEDDFSRSWEFDYEVEDVLDAEQCAKEIAESEFYDDPCDVEDFKIVIGIELTNKKRVWFIIKAELIVDFNAHQCEAPIEVEDL